jgi:adenosine kinase
MEILVSGSMAYDRIMDFPGRFSDHIMPDKLDMINVSFTVNGLKENLGGTAGNIAYVLSLLGETPRILAAMGHDYHQYYQWLEKNGIGTGDIRIIADELTASAYITTDEGNNQITGFNPGAMKHPSLCDLSKTSPADCMAIVAPGNLQDMAEYAEAYQKNGVFCIFDPGQSLPIWDGAELATTIGRANMLISNDYELGLIQNATGLSADQLLEKVATIVTTKAELGCDVRTAAGTVIVPVVPTPDAVDPTGAGDAFRGGLIKGLVEGQSVERAVQMGTVCAHYAVRMYGTQEYSFTMEEFSTTLEQTFGKAAG